MYIHVLVSFYWRVSFVISLLILYLTTGKTWGDPLDHVSPFSLLRLYLTMVMSTTGALVSAFAVPLNPRDPTSAHAWEAGIHARQREATEAPRQTTQVLLFGHLCLLIRTFQNRVRQSNDHSPPKQNIIEDTSLSLSLCIYVYTQDALVRV